METGNWKRNWKQKWKHNLLVVVVLDRYVCCWVLFLVAQSSPCLQFLITCFASLAFFPPLQVAICVLANTQGSNGSVSCPDHSRVGSGHETSNGWDCVKLGLCMNTLFASHTASDQIKLEVGVALEWGCKIKTAGLVLRPSYSHGQIATSLVPRPSRMWTRLDCNFACHSHSEYVITKHSTR